MNKIFNVLYYFLLSTVTFFNLHAQEITYNGHIKPIINQRCMPCHQNDDIGAMPLTSFEEVKSYAKMISYVTHNKIMPPFNADNGSVSFKSRNTLSAAEIERIKKWVDGGSKRGIDTLEPIQTKYESIHIQNPDVSFGVSHPYTQKGDQLERTQVFVIPINLKKDLYVDSIEFVPGNKKIVQNCFISIDTSQLSAQYDKNDPQSGYSSFVVPGFYPFAYNWYYWQPRSPIETYTTRLIKKIPANCRIMLQINYKAISNAESDSSSVKFTIKPDSLVQNVIQSQLFLNESDINNPPFIIEKNEKKRFYARKKITNDILIHSVTPLAHFSCQQWEIYAIDKNTARRINIVNIPKWDVHWREKYIFSNPIKLSAGTEVHAIGYYNNSDENQNLVTLPVQKLKSGLGTKNELFSVCFDVSEIK